MPTNNQLSHESKTLKEIAFDMNILLVEDDAILLGQLEQFLSKFFLSVDTALNGVEALSKYEYKIYDLVITDLSMPLMNGMELAKRIKATKESQRIMVASAYSESEKLMELINIGVDGFILKPLDMDIVIKALNKTCQAIYEHKMFLYFSNILEETNKELKESNNELEATLNELTLTKISIKKQNTMAQETEENTNEAHVSSDKISATEFHNAYLFELDKINENLEELEDTFNLMIIGAEQNINQNTLYSLIGIFRDFSKEIEMIPQFTQLYDALQQLAITMELVNDSSKLKIIMPMIAALFDNLEVWRKGVFYYKNLEDIHVMDSSLIDNLLNLKNFFNNHASLNV